MGQCNYRGKDFKRDYAKEQLWENMEQGELGTVWARERDFKE
jgi:hypothetical protein